MAEIVRMPKMSDTMTEGVLAKWHKKVGDKIKSGDLVAEIETDKATMEFESYQEGTILYLGIEEGKSVPVDTVIAVLGNAGEDYKALLAAESTGAPAPAVESAPKAAAAPAPSAPAPAPVASTNHAAPVAKANNNDGRIFASPLAKKMASDKGLDINSIPGSGENGRVIKKDIENFKGGYAAPSAAVAGRESYTEVAVSQMRKVIAKRLAESKFTAPHFYLTIDIDMDQAVAMRSKLIDLSGQKISFNDMVIKAVAHSLKKHPDANSSWLGDKIRYNDHVHIGVAVAVPDGLLVPVVRFADQKSLSSISAEVKSLGQKAKEKKLQPSDWEGNTFTISNLGMFGIEEFTAIINPPDACIMAVGAIRDEAVVKNGAVVAGKRMKVTLSCDHRVVDGAVGSAFLQTFKQLLEEPLLLMSQGNL